MAKVTTGQILKTVCFAVLGGLPGAFWFYHAGSIQSLVIMALGIFIGSMLSLPGVSAANVLAGTAGVIVAHNVSRSSQNRVLEAFVGDRPDAKEPDLTPPKDESQSADQKA
jgi:hypothetical protein